MVDHGSSWSTIAVHGRPWSIVVNFVWVPVSIYYWKYRDFSSETEITVTCQARKLHVWPFHPDDDWTWHLVAVQMHANFYSPRWHSVQTEYPFMSNIWTADIWPHGRFSITWHVTLAVLIITIVTIQHIPYLVMERWCSEKSKIYCLTAVWPHHYLASILEQLHMSTLLQKW